MTPWTAHVEKDHLEAKNANKYVTSMDKVLEKALDKIIQYKKSRIVSKSKKQKNDQPTISISYSENDETVPANVKSSKKKTTLPPESSILFEMWSLRIVQRIFKSMKMSHDNVNNEMNGVNSTVISHDNDNDEFVKAGNSFGGFEDIVGTMGVPVWEDKWFEVPLEHNYGIKSVGSTNGYCTAESTADNIDFTRDVDTSVNENLSNTVVSEIRVLEFIEADNQIVSDDQVAPSTSSILAHRGTHMEVCEPCSTDRVVPIVGTDSSVYCTTEFITDCDFSHSDGFKELYDVLCDDSFATAGEGIGNVPGEAETVVMKGSPGQNSDGRTAGSTSLESRAQRAR